MSDQDATTLGGHRIITMNSGLRIANRAADRCRSLLASTQRTGNRSEVLPDVHGRSSKQRGPPRNPATEALEQKQRETRIEREAPKSVRQHFVLSTRDPFLLRRPLPFIARKEAVCIQFFTNRIQPLDPRMYLIRP